MITNYYLIVDTNSYTGNFEREMSTFMTGWTDGYCDGIKKEFRARFPDKQDYAYDVLQLVNTEYGESIVEMDCSQSGSYTSLIFLFEGEPKSEDIEFLKQRAIEFTQECDKRSDGSFQFLNGIKITGFRLKTETIDCKYESI